MKEQRWINVLLTCAVVLLLLGEMECTSMAIDFELDSGDQYINFGTPAALSGLTTRTIMAWVQFESLNGDGYDMLLARRHMTGGGSFDGGWFFRPAETYLQYWNASVSATTLWYANFEFEAGYWYHVAVTFDNSNIANVPILYKNGVSIAITQVGAPNATFGSGDAYDVLFGGTGDVTAAIAHDGQIADLRIYNRILTAGEILDIASSRCMSQNINGLVFAPMLYGAVGLQAFDGAALAAENTILDPYSGAVGVPTGSPVGSGETYLSICP